MQVNDERVDKLTAELANVVDGYTHQEVIHAFGIVTMAMGIEQKMSFEEAESVGSHTS